MISDIVVHLVGSVLVAALAYAIGYRKGVAVGKEPEPKPVTGVDGWEYVSHTNHGDNNEIRMMVCHRMSGSKMVVIGRGYSWRVEFTDHPPSILMCDRLNAVYQKHVVWKHA